MRYQPLTAELIPECVGNGWIGEAISRVPLPFIFAPSTVLGCKSALSVERNNSEAGLSKAAGWDGQLNNVRIVALIPSGNLALATGHFVRLTSNVAS